jgi:hypothetical protein
MTRLRKLLGAAGILVPAVAPNDFVQLHLSVAPSLRTKP